MRLRTGLRQFQRSRRGTQHFRAHNTLPEDPSSVISTFIRQHTSTYNSSSKGSHTSGLHGHRHPCVYDSIQTPHSIIKNKMNLSKEKQFQGVAHWQRANKLGMCEGLSLILSKERREEETGIVLPERRKACKMADRVRGLRGFSPNLTCNPQDRRKEK